MINGNRISLVLPAYPAEKTLEATVPALPDLVDIRFLTAFENLFLGVKLSEYHTGYRAFSAKVLLDLPLLENSDDFVFDNQMLAQCVHFGFRIGEVSCPTKYFENASSINFRRSVKYGLGVLATTLEFALQRMGVAKFRIFSAKGRRLEPGYATYYGRRAGAPEV